MQATAAVTAPSTPPPPAVVDEVSFATAGRERLLPLASIRRDPRAQPRAQLHTAIVETYRAAMAPEAGEEGRRPAPSWGSFPAVVVYQQGDAYHLADGFHRLAAAEGAGLRQVRAEVRPGDLRAAILHSVGANAQHGLPRTNEDKRRAVLALLADPEWSQWSDRAIAHRAAVSHPFVASLRGEREPTSVTGNGFQSTPAASSGQSTGHGVASGPAPRPDPPRARERKGQDGRTIDTGKIGQGASRRAPAAPGKATSADLDKALAVLTRKAPQLRAPDRRWLAAALEPVVAELRRRLRAGG